MAFSYPERIESDVSPLRLDTLTFLPPREDVFPLPALAKRAIAMGGNACAVLNAANEAAVALFLAGKIRFTDIAKIVQMSLDTTPVAPLAVPEDVFATHAEVYEKRMTDYTKILRSAL